jgi:hypothetical protein
MVGVQISKEMSDAMKDEVGLYEGKSLSKAMKGAEHHTKKFTLMKEG